MFGNVDFFEMLIRTIATFSFLLLLTRMLGKEQMSQLTFFNYITGITIGSIAADIAGQSETPFFNGLISLICWALLTLLVSYLGMKFAKVRSITDGRPTVVMKNGKIVEDELSKLRLNVDELSMLLREQQIFSISEVEQAVFEPNGHLSVLLKTEHQPVTKSDQKKFVATPLYVPTGLVADGVIQEKQLHGVGFSKQWLKTQLDKHKLKLEDIFYLELQSDGTLFIDKRDKPSKNN